MVIVLEREWHGGCAGPVRTNCPAHIVRLDGTGAVRFEGKHNMAYLGAQTAQVDAARVLELANEFLAAHFFEAQDSYDTTRLLESGEQGELVLRERHSIGGWRAFLRLKVGSHNRRVMLYRQVPDDLTRLAERVDEVAGTERWLPASQ